VMDDTLESLTREGDLERQFLKIVQEAEGSSDSDDRDLTGGLRGDEVKAAAHNPGAAPRSEQ